MPRKALVRFWLAVTCLFFTRYHEYTAYVNLLLISYGVNILKIPGAFLFMTQKILLYSSLYYEVHGVQVYSRHHHHSSVQVYSISE